MMGVGDWIGSIATVIAAGAAVASLFAARGSQAAAKELAQIEAARRHADLTPHIVARLVRQPSTDVVLRFEVTGPREVVLLDRVVVRTRPEGVDWTARTKEEYRAAMHEFTWGPGQFRPQMDGNPSLTESRTFTDVSQATEFQTSVEKSTAPRDWKQEAWDSRYADQPMRLVFECTRGAETWHVHLNVDASLLYETPTGLS